MVEKIGSLELAERIEDFGSHADLKHIEWNSFYRQWIVRYFVG